MDCLGEVQDERLGCGIGRGPRQRLEGRGRSDVEHGSATALDHRRQVARLEVEQRFDVEADHAQKPLALGRVKPIPPAEARIVDQHLHLEAQLGYPRGHCVPAGLFSEVPTDRLRADTVLAAEPVRERPEAIRAPRDEGNVLTAARQLLGNRFPDARRRAGHERHRGLRYGRQGHAATQAIYHRV
jgi:hypothetical protein